MDWPGMTKNLHLLQHPVLLIQSWSGLSAGHSYLCSSCANQASTSQAGFALNETLNLLTDFQPCHWSYMKGFWQGRIPPQRQPCCESLRLAFSFAVCSLPSLATFPATAPFCLPQRGTTEVYSSINSSAGNLPGCLHFHYNLLSPDSRGCLEIGSMVRSSMLYNCFLMCLDPFGVLCTDALGLAYLLQTASMKQGKSIPCFCLSVLQVLMCLWNKSRQSKYRAHGVSKNQDLLHNQCY